MPKLPDQLMWNPTSQVWETPTDLLGQREPFLATFPKEGTLQDGVLFLHQKPGHRTDESEYSFLPTPRASEPGSTSEGYRPGLGELVSKLLPTPATSDRFGPNKPPTRGGSDALRTVACYELELLRSPTISDTKTPDRSGLRASKGHQTNLADQIEQRFGSSAEPGQDWGRYQAAIERWENVLHTPAPAPTELNRNDRPRLKAGFSEWMMGWPAGWVTDPKIGLSRAAQLKMIGNGVCPQQAVVALRKLLEV